MITEKELKSRVRYDDLTGNLLRIKPQGRGGRWKVDSVVGTKDKDGYIVTYMGKYYKVHHLVWLYHHGYLPNMLDHINRNPSDNRIENLREVNKRCNSINSKLQRNNTSGIKGISWNKSLCKWEAYIHFHNKKKGLGYFLNIKDAKEARLLEENKTEDFVIYGRKEKKHS